MKLSIGMAHNHDYGGAWDTIQTIRRDLLPYPNFEYEINIADTSYGSKSSDLLHKYIRDLRDPKGPQHQQFNIAILKGNPGPAIAKNITFEMAEADVCLCVDCHVKFMMPDAPVKLMEWFQRNSKSLDMITAPLVLNNFIRQHTHLDKQWRGHSWGKWGYDKRADHPKAEPFELWAQGCFFMAMRKEAWPKFNANVRGFGSEEGFIHEKVRKNGGRVLCHPYMGTMHRFGHENDIKFEISSYTKARNAVLESVEIGLDVQPIYDHFVSLKHDGDLVEHLRVEHSVPVAEMEGKTHAQLEAIHRSKKLPEGEWEFIMADPEKKSATPPKRAETLEKIFNTLKAEKKSDMGPHLDQLKDLAGRVEVIEEVTRRRASTVALLSGSPKRLTTHVFSSDINSDVYTKLPKLAETGGTELILDKAVKFRDFEINECDLLFYKTPHNHHTLMEDLERWHGKVGKFIVVHDTANHAVDLDDGTVGYGMQLRAFMLDNPEWFITSHSAKAYGLTVLTKDPTLPKLEDPWPAGRGPGTNYKRMNKDLGVNPKPNCSCNRLMIDMDNWKVAGCRERLGEILDKINKNLKNWKWHDRYELAKAAGKIVMNGMVLKLDPLHPISSAIEVMVNAAIEQAAIDEETMEVKSCSLGK